MAYIQNAGRGNESPKAPIAMHGPLHQEKEKTRRIAMTGDLVKNEETGEKNFKFNRQTEWQDMKNKPGWEENVVTKPGYDISENARKYVHKIKESNFFRPSDKVIFKVPKSKLDDPNSKLTTEPVEYEKRVKKGTVDSKGNYIPKGRYKVDSMKDATHYSDITPRETRRSNIKEKVKMGVQGLAAGIGWHLTNTLGK